MNQATIKVNPEAGPLKQKKSPFFKSTWNQSAPSIAFLFSMFLAMLLSSGLEAAESTSERGSGWYNDSCCKLERNGPGKPRIRPVQIGQPSESAFRKADYEVTRNMILSLQEKPMPVPMIEFISADREMGARFIVETTMKPVFSQDADDAADLAFRSENVQGPTHATLADLDSMMDTRFRIENGLNG